VIEPSSAGPFEGKIDVTIYCNTPGSTIYWTDDGHDPSTASSIYSGPIAVTRSSTIIKAMGLADGEANSQVSVSEAYHIKPLPPIISPNGGVFEDSVTIEMSSETEGSLLHYSLDGSSPTAASLLYSGPIRFATTGIIVKAIALHPDMDDSDVVESKSFTVAAAAPTFDPLAGTYIGQVEVNIVSTTAGSAIRCTTDGSIPTESSAVCLMPVVVTQTGTMIKAVATKDGMSVSAVASLAAAFVIKGVSPVVSPNGGSFTESATVVLSCSNPTAKIYWTLDGSMPTAEATLYTEPIVIEDNDSIVKAISIAEGKSPSEPMTSRLFTIEAGRVEFTAEGNKWGEETATSEGFVEEVKVRSCHSFVLAAALLASA
jgi:hypothetical protein